VVASPGFFLYFAMTPAYGSPTPDDVSWLLELAVPDAGRSFRLRARRGFDNLSYTHRKEHVRALEDAKKPETRQRRLAKTLVMLRAAK
jgi:hypothetical protein